MHYVGLNDYMMKDLLVMNEVVFTYYVMYELDVKACGLMIGLLSMCEVMGSYM